MADIKELKPKSFRIDDETADRFKEISGKIGGNQQETLSKLIEAFEFQSGKAILTEKKADIELFEKYVNALTRMFMGSLEDNQNVTEVVRTEFDALLKSKDATIQDLQEKLTAAKQIKEDATTKAKAYADENMRLNALIDNREKEYTAKMEDMEDTLKDKAALADTLKDACQDLKTKVDAMKHEHEQFVTLSSELDELKRKREQVERDNSDLQKQLERESKEHEKALADQKQHEIDALERLREQLQLTMDKSILELEKKHHAQIEKLKEQKQVEVDKYQQKYFDLLEQLKIQSSEESILTHYDEETTMAAFKKEYFEAGQTVGLIKKLMQNEKKTFDEACTILDVSAEDKARYAEMM